jgi:hypothetical protein
MAKARSTLALVLLFVWTAAPALRCLVPGEVLTAEEQACCRSMGGQCGDSPTSGHPCCKRVTSTAQPALAASQAALSAPVLAPASIPVVANSTVEQRFVNTWLIDPSPPHRSQASSVLRI